MIPGRSLHRLAVSMFPADAREQFIEPQLADFQYEWAHAKGFAPRLAALARGYGSFWHTLVLCAPHALSKRNFDTLRRATETFLMSAFVQVFIMRERVVAGVMAWLIFLAFMKAFHVRPAF